MDVMAAIKGRRSVRKFTGQPVGKEALLKLLDAAVWAPSGGNAQTWRFVVVTDPERMRRLRMVSPGLLGRPPAAIVIAQDLALAERKGGKMGKESLAKMDSAMAAQNILLAAYEMGLGTCVVASFHPGAVGRILKLPDHILPQLIVSVGHPAANPPPPPRKFEELIWWETYGGQDCS
ncbi:MAG: nitroreductase family protein [Deltaproteobacteria bacterium]|nr:nitroreductase family protein [Deltaproteobacteria bacterium]MBW2026259.1 nitroreductase family protein [Deltaproteobacteria bacterium]MBW2126167.1 nitroreductase family protein [Deltaproteobacteria bacterium]